MASPKLKTVEVACPKCGHTQPEPTSAISTNCKKCRAYFRVQEALHPVDQPSKPGIEQRSVRCWQCGTDLQAPVAATSTMCKRCSSHIDLADYVITQTVSKNFRTYGRLVIEEKGYVLNSEARVREAVIKGRLIGKIHAADRLEIYTTAQIKGSFDAGTIVIPAGQHFRWPETLKTGAVEVAGELVTNLQSAGTVILRASSRFFGEIEAKNLIVESGAVFVGTARVGAFQASGTGG
jgi:cytoskeletal protein CcmA (bactofilin family)